MIVIIEPTDCHKNFVNVLLATIVFPYLIVFFTSSSMLKDVLIETDITSVPLSNVIIGFDFRLTIGEI